MTNFLLIGTPIHDAKYTGVFEVWVSIIDCVSSKKNRQHATQLFEGHSKLFIPKLEWTDHMYMLASWLTLINF